MLDHLDDPKTIFEGGIRKMGDWKFPIVLCPITNKHPMPTKWPQTTCEWHRNLRDFQSGETGFCCRETHGKGLCTVYLILSWQQLGYRCNSFRGTPPTGVPLLQVPPTFTTDMEPTNRAPQGPCPSSLSENELLLYYTPHLGLYCCCIRCP